LKPQWGAAAVFEHEATTSKISEEMLSYRMQRGLSQEDAVARVVNGFVRDVLGLGRMTRVRPDEIEPSSPSRRVVNL
jgi:Fe-S cluster assembly scaffold protein SufB